MRFAVNYSNPLIRLLKEKAVQIDLIKCPDWEGMLTEAKPFGPVTIHYDLTAGLGQTLNVDLNQLKSFKEQTETPHINSHLVTPRNFDTHDHKERIRINHLWREEIKTLVEYFGETSVTLEHYPYTTANEHIAYAADAAAFSQVILDTGCQLLLDLAHARITADTLNIDVKDYIRALPLDRLTELHITGIRSHAGVLTDHFELCNEDWDFFNWALREIKTGNWPEPRIVAFEYGGVGDVFVWRTDYHALKQQIPRMYDMIHS